MVLLTGVTVHGSYASDLLSGLLPLSIGIGLTFVPITLLATGGVDSDDAGLASGLFNTSQQVGGSLGLALMSTFAASRTTSLLHGGMGAAAARVSGYHLAFAIAAGMLIVGGALLVAMLRRAAHRSTWTSTSRAVPPRA